MTVNNDLLYFESCHTSWCFNTVKLRFKRIPRPLARQASATDFVHAQWEPYFKLNVGDQSEEFTVVLNKSESRLLRSWRHSPNCIHCFGGDSEYQTEEISLARLNDLLNRRE